MPTVHTPHTGVLQQNRALAAIFDHWAAIYRYLGPAERFRAAAYERAAKTMLQLDVPVAVLAGQPGELDALPGIGDHIAQKITEFVATGSIAAFEKIKRQVPYGLFALLHARDVGPATLRLLHQALGVRTPQELAQAIQNGRLRGVKGISEKKTELLRRALRLPETHPRLPLAEALELGTRFLKAIEALPGVRRARLAGSLRRQKATIGDIDVVVAADPALHRMLMQQITLLPQVWSVLAAGASKVSVVLKDRNLQADVRMVAPGQWGAALLYFTGSKEHNIALRMLARQKGWKMNEYGMFDAAGRRLAGATEAGMYRLLGLHFIEPEARVGGTEIERAFL